MPGEMCSLMRGCRGRAWAASFLLSVSSLCLLVLCATQASPVHAQAMSGRLEAVATTQAYSGLSLELVMFEYEDGKTYGRQGTAKKVITKSASGDAAASAEVQLPLGKDVVICVWASQAGTLTLWSQIDDKRPDKIYPNSRTPSVKGAGPIKANEEVCVGHTPEFRFRVTGQPGQLDKVYAHWAPPTGGQLNPEDFPAIGRSAPAPGATATYASATVQFRIGR